MFMFKTMTLCTQIKL